jgi:hypothetical protein
VVKAHEVKITRQWLEERCVKDEQHLLWKLSCGNGGPRGHGRDADGNEGQFAVRHAAWALWHGKHPAAGMTARPSCGIHNCLSKNCLALMVHGGYNRGRPRSLVTRQKMAERARQMWGHPPHVVAAIKTSTKPAKEVARELNVGLCTVYEIRGGKRWRDYTNPMGAMAAQLAGAR